MAHRDEHDSQTWQRQQQEYELPEVARLHAGTLPIVSSGAQVPAVWVGTEWEEHAPLSSDAEEELRGAVSQQFACAGCSIGVDIVQQHICLAVEVAVVHERAP